MKCEVIEIRYSFNGMTDKQIHTFFNQIDNEESQIILKRISDYNFALSKDDIVFEGNFSWKFIKSVSVALDPPLSCTIKINSQISTNLLSHISFNWGINSNLGAGVTILPVDNMQKMINFKNPLQFLNLIISTKAGSLLKSLLLIKPKGLIELKDNYLTIIFPNHRLDFILYWLEKMNDEEITLDWLSGSTDELPLDLVNSVSSFNSSDIDDLNSCIELSSSISSVDLEIMFSRALKAIK